MLDHDRLWKMVDCGQFEQAIALCREEIELEPAKSDNYLLLGRVLLAAGRKKEAIRVFSDGLLFENNPRLRNELNRLGWRKFRVISSLSREHPLNRMLGKLFKALNLRR